MLITRLTRLTKSIAILGVLAFTCKLAFANAAVANKVTLASASESTASPMSLREISKRYIPQPETVGKARLKVMFWKIYDAQLMATKGEWQEGAPFALSLTYLRDFDGEEIASRSVDEMRDLGYDDEVDLAKWFEQMRAVFPDVKEGDNITGVLDENRHTHFYYRGQKVGSIDDVTFGQSFFDIWLSDKTSEPKMRKQLLGLN
ncbi:chalcone isomerase family protein [Glaciecola sp. MH2013]|uniref:chalcone isomerase family protein n=1 Tax=Glaciecola sp. MH2013 TaxID=2785524 RepID=UPI00189ECF06|nr:chalcone isomerase family protein [Glaciecola sp. MH2013]MBF7071976.1 chalcone isomerase family protein [Glaciecola sp. MH2013]